jgi:hypothetical protein
MIGRFRAGLRVACIGALLAGLAACSSTGGGSSTGDGVATATTSTASEGSMISRIFGKSDKPDDIPQEYFVTKGYCPPLRIRGGTAVYTLYERGKDADPTAVRYSASIGKTARQCDPTGSGLAIKVGVAGRAIAGPKGTAGSITLPLRVVVTRADNSVAYSQLFKVAVNLQPPDLGADFEQIITTIDLPMAPNERDVTIYVGFDEGKPA